MEGFLVEDSLPDSHEVLTSGARRAGDAAADEMGDEIGEEEKFSSRKLKLIPGEKGCGWLGVVGVPWGVGAGSVVILGFSCLRLEGTSGRLCR